MLPILAEITVSLEVVLGILGLILGIFFKQLLLPMFKALLKARDKKSSSAPESETIDVVEMDQNITKLVNNAKVTSLVLERMARKLEVVSSSLSELVNWHYGKGYATETDDILAKIGEIKNEVENLRREVGSIKSKDDQGSKHTEV